MAVEVLSLQNPDSLKKLMSSLTGSTQGDQSLQGLKIIADYMRKEDKRQTASALIVQTDKQITALSVLCVTVLLAHWGSEEPIAVFLPFPSPAGLPETETPLKQAVATAEDHPSQPLGLIAFHALNELYRSSGFVPASDYTFASPFPVEDSLFLCKPFNEERLNQASGVVNIPRNIRPYLEFDRN